MNTVVPLEESDPELAEHLRLIANREHTAVQGVACQGNSLVITKNDGQQVFRKIKLPGRNDPCYCDSGRKFKKCCGR
ncbi:MAG: SEC-C metal-binding domain-containing protein [Planctomycetota bacterium]|jgi:uncharacterized protein YecA (UPF0149 family)